MLGREDVVVEGVENGSESEAAFDKKGLEAGESMPSKEIN